jgi:HK97 family phage major capsid protein
MTAVELQEFNTNVDKLAELKALHAKVSEADELMAWANKPAPGIRVAPGAEAAKPAATQSLGFWDVLKHGRENAAYRESMIADLQKQGFSQAELPGGGYFVTPLQIAAEVILDPLKSLYIRRNANVNSLVGAQSLGVVKVADLDDFAWTSEVGTISQSTEDPVSIRELSPKRLSKLIRISRKLVRNSPNAEAVFFQLCQRAKGYTEEKAFISGNGINRPLGFNVADANGVSTSRDQSAAAANSVTFDDIIKTYALIEEPYRAALSCIMHRNMEARVRLLKDGDNRYIWNPVGTSNPMVATVGMASTLNGVPIYVSEFMPDPGVGATITAGIYPLTFANFREGYWIADNLLMEIIPMTETFASSNEMGFTFNSDTDGMPVNQKAFARVKTI